MNLENLKKESSYNKNKKASDYIMVYDFLKDLHKIHSEKVLVEKFIDLIRMIFSPNKIMFITLEDYGEIKTCACSPNCFDKSELMNFYQNKKNEIYNWTKSDRGFCIKVNYRDKVNGLILLDELMFPEHKKAYLSTLLDISSILGLSIHQIRTNAKLLESKNMLLSEKAYLNQLFEGSPECILSLDKNLNIKKANNSFMELFNFRKKDLIGMKVQEILLNIGKSENFIAYYIDKLKKGENVKLEIEMRDKDTEIKYFKMISYPVRVSDEIKGYYILLSDISDNKNKENKIKKMAYLDHLTGLNNRRLFEIIIKDSINSCKLKKGKFALFILDLNKFKAINDTFGHLVGDDVLIKTAFKLKECLRESDKVFRLGGDEFAVIMPIGSRSDQVKKMTERILNNLDIKFSFEGSEVRVSTSIGVAVFPDDGVDEKTLYIKADKLMYNSKLKN